MNNHHSTARTIAGRIPRAGEKVLYILVDKKNFTLIGYADEKNKTVIAGPWPCAIGSNPDGADKQRVGDCRTPEGKHLIVSSEDSQNKMFEDEYSYGPWFLRLKGIDETNKEWVGIAIHGHGPDRENELGTKASHGCVRIANENISYLKTVVVDGETIVEIVP